MRLEEIQIPAVSPEYVEQPPAATGVISASLEQRNRFRLCKYTFGLFDTCILSIKVDGLIKRLPGYEFNIAILNPEPRRLVSINWGYLAAFLILSMGAILAAPSNLFPNPSMASGLLAANAIVFFLLAAYSCRNRLVFYSRNGRAPLVTLFYRNPNDEKFRAFTNALTAQIRLLQSRYRSQCEMLRDDLIEHRRLMERGIISKKHYAWIKQYILFLHQNEPGVRFDESRKRATRGQVS